MAFDSEKGRVWVICRRCTQWNLVPLEERWEILDECKQVAASAESRVDSGGLGFARTVTGLELLRAEEFSNVDIANWRYGRRLKRRQLFAWATAGVFAVLAMVLGIRVASASGSSDVGYYAFMVAAVWLGFVWRDPPRLSVKVVPSQDRPLRVWSWRMNEIRIETSEASQLPVLILPRRNSEIRLRGLEAARALASLLRALNDADCANASVARAVADVDAAEAKSGRNARANEHLEKRRGRTRSRGGDPIPPARRPWERLAGQLADRPLLSAEPQARLALEMAVTEEIEQHEMAESVQRAHEEWAEEETIGAIADDLLIPDAIRDRLRDTRSDT